MYQLSSQRGVGLVEVLVALLLLAVAVLGFTAMQMAAVKATEESLMRTRALTVMRGGAEAMRANPEGIEAFKNAINSAEKKIDGDIYKYIKDTSKKCQYDSKEPNADKKCTIEELAIRDALLLNAYAIKNDMLIGLAPDGCPGTVGKQVRQCFIASWGATTLKLDDSDTACANADGTYKNGAECFIMEAY